MSEPIPESIPTSADPKSHRPIKKRALTPVSKQAAHVEALFANPDKPINLSRPETKGPAPPPEIMTSVQGSSAGAGSGEFHVYKASRRREYERIRAMEEESRKEKEDKEWEAKREEIKKRDEEKLGKNRKRRAKAKERMGKKKGDEKSEGEGKPGEAKLRKLEPMRRRDKDGEDEVETEGGEVQALAAEEETGITILDED